MLCCEGGGVCIVRVKGVCCEGGGVCIVRGEEVCD